MKKALSFLCIFALIFALAACSGQTDTQTNSPSATSSEAPSSQPSATPSDSPQPTDSEPTEEPSEEPEVTEPTDTNVLVAYFSATGNTRALAEYAADALGADLYEITPEEPYTSDDLNYGNDDSRTSIEQNDASARPAISGSVENMEQYDTVFLGYPIWWGDAPRIICTFLESYDFSGKTIVPFCTSGSSGIGSSAQDLHALVSDDATWLDGARLSSDSSREDMVSWINGLGLELAAE